MTPTIPDFFKELLWEQWAKEALKRLLARSAFFSWGPVSYIITEVVGEYLGELYDLMKEWVDFQDLAFNNKDLRVKFDREALECQLVLDAYGINSPEFEVARDRSKKKLSEFLNANRPKTAPRPPISIASLLGMRNRT